MLRIGPMATGDAANRAVGDGRRYDLESELGLAPQSLTADDENPGLGCGIDVRGATVTGTAGNEPAAGAKPLPTRENAEAVRAPQDVPCAVNHRTA